MAKNPFDPRGTHKDLGIPDTRTSQKLPPEFDPDKTYKDLGITPPSRGSGGPSSTGGPSTSSPTSTGLSQEQLRQNIQREQARRVGDLNIQLREKLTNRNLTQNERNALVNQFRQDVQNIKKQTGQKKVDTGLITRSTLTEGGFTPSGASKDFIPRTTQISQPGDKDFIGPINISDSERARLNRINQGLVISTRPSTSQRISELISQAKIETRKKFGFLFRGETGETPGERIGPRAVIADVSAGLLIRAPKIVGQLPGETIKGTVFDVPITIPKQEVPRRETILDTGKGGLFFEPFETSTAQVTKGVGELGGSLAPFLLPTPVLAVGGVAIATAPSTSSVTSEEKIDGAIFVLPLTFKATGRVLRPFGRTALSSLKPIPLRAKGTRFTPLEPAISAVERKRLFLLPEAETKFTTKQFIQPVITKKGGQMQLIQSRLVGKTPAQEAVLTSDVRNILGLRPIEVVEVSKPITRFAFTTPKAPIVVKGGVIQQPSRFLTFTKRKRPSQIVNLFGLGGVEKKIDVELFKLLPRKERLFLQRLAEKKVGRPVPQGSVVQILGKDLEAARGFFVTKRLARLNIKKFEVRLSTKDKSKVFEEFGVSKKVGEFLESEGLLIANSPTKVFKTFSTSKQLKPVTKTIRGSDYKLIDDDLVIMVTEKGLGTVGKSIKVKGQLFLRPTINIPQGSTVRVFKGSKQVVNKQELQKVARQISSAQAQALKLQAKTPVSTKYISKTAQTTKQTQFGSTLTGQPLPPSKFQGLGPGLFQDTFVSKAQLGLLSGGLFKSELVSGQEIKVLSELDKPMITELDKARILEAELSKEELKIKQEQKIVQKIKTQQKLKTLQRLKTEINQLFLQTPTGGIQKVKTPTIKIPVGLLKGGTGISKKKKVAAGPQGYKAEALRKKKWVRLNRKGPLTKRQAENLMGYVVDTSLSAQGRVKKVNKSPVKPQLKIPTGYFQKTRNQLRSFMRRGKKKIPLPKNQYIEKRRFRLSVPNEVRSIQAARRSLMKTKTKKKTKRRKKR